MRDVKLNNGYSLRHVDTSHLNRRSGPSYEFDVHHESSQKPIGRAHLTTTSTGEYGGGSVVMHDMSHEKAASKIGQQMKEHLFPAKHGVGQVINVEHTVKKTSERLDDLIRNVQEILKKGTVNDIGARRWRKEHEGAGRTWHHALDEAMSAHAPHGVDPHDTHQAVKDFKEAYPKVSHSEISAHIKQHWPEAHPHLKSMGKAEILEKPPVSEAQRRAMHAAASGHSTLGIPKSVGKDFADADEGGKLPEKKKVKKGEDEAEKSDKKDEKAKKEQGPLGEYWKQPLNDSKPKVKVAESIDYSKLSAPKPSVSNPAAANAKIAEQKRQAGQVPSKAPKALDTIRERQKVNKAEVGTLTSEALTKSMRSSYNDEQITAMLKAAVDTGNLHRNVLLEWANFRTINPAVITLASANDSEE